MVPDPEKRTPTPVRRAREAAAWVAVALAAACAVRLPRVLADDFPINDGGIFYVMTGELAAARLALPATTSYNGARIPFAYPPLALELAAAIHLATGAPVLELLRFLPVAANLGVVVVVFFLARSLLGSGARAGLAAVTFALLPRGYEYLVMGGGLTRSFGFVFACLAVAAAHRLLVERRSGAAVPAAVALGLAALAHPEMGVWAAASVALLAVAAGADRRNVASAAAVAAGAALLSAPWWVTTLARHGLAPFLAAGATSEWGVRPLLGLLGRGATGERGLAPFAILALAGALDALARRRFLLPAWLVLTFAVIPRSAPTAAAVPLALLATSALTDAIPRAAERLLPRLRGGAARVRATAALAAVPLLGYTLVVSNLGRTPEAWPSMRRVPPAEREAMAWVAAHAGAGRRFLVASASRSWWADPVDAWFPALTGRASVATPNGAEWLPAGEFARRVAMYDALKRCPRIDAPCLDGLAARFGAAFTDVYVSRPGPATTLDAGGYALVYDGPGAAVFARRPAAGEPARAD